MLSRRDVLKTGGAHRRPIWIFPLVCLALAPASAVGQTYRWVDEQGAVHYAQGLDNVPERYRPLVRLSPREQTAAREALTALKAFEALMTPEMGSLEYGWRLRQVEEVVPRKLRAMRRSPVQTALAAALRHYRAAAPLVASDRTASVRPDRQCPRLARPDTPRDRAAATDDRSAALQALWRCASEQIAVAERALADKPGARPRAERVPTPPKPRP